MTRPALCLLAALALLLARRRPAWRPFALELVALACIDVARLWTSPLAQARAAPWWQVDVALVALWPVVLGVGLLAGRHHRSDARFPLLVCGGPLIPSGAVARILRHGREHEEERWIGGAAEHAPILPHLALLAAFALALGAARPWLPRIAYLSALRLPRWALASLWVEALCRLKTKSPEAEAAGLSSGRLHAPSFAGEKVATEAAGGERMFSAGGRQQASAPLACALILAGCNAADLIAGAWACAPWEAPAWGYARAVTWAAYGAVACVMGWAWARNR